MSQEENAENKDVTGKEENERRRRGKRPRSRVREVDFMRIENTMHNEPLSAFELQVRTKIACVASPYEELIRMEEEDQEAKKMKRMKMRLAHLVRRANLTPKQRACYELLYVEKVSVEEAARRLPVSVPRLLNLQKALTKALIRAHAKKDPMSMDRESLTAKQKQVWKLRHEEGLTFDQIAERLETSKENVFGLYRRGNRNNFPLGKS